VSRRSGLTAVNMANDDKINVWLFFSHGFVVIVAFKSSCVYVICA
jgi:hypothetical protein